MATPCIIIVTETTQVGGKDVTQTKEYTTAEFMDMLVRDSKMDEVIGYKPKEVEKVETVKTEKVEAVAETKEGVKGSKISFIHAGNEKTGKIVDIDKDGNYKVVATDGAKHTVKPENAKIQKPTAIESAESELKDALKNLGDVSDITKLGVKGADPEKQAEAIYRVHKALVKLAKEYISKGITDVKDFAKRIGISAKNAQQAWDEAMGVIKHTKETIDYDIADIAKVAIRRGINVREKFAEYKQKSADLKQAVSDFIKDKELNGSLSSVEVKALVKKAANVSTEKQLEKFIDYAEKVINDANYVAQMDEVRAMQKAAKRRNHVSMSGAVKEFTSVNPEDISPSDLADYISALNKLNQRVPSYDEMNTMFNVARQFQPPKAFENVTTYKQADKALQEALGANIQTIEDYRELLKNVKAFNKRVNELFENGTISEDERDALLDSLAKNKTEFDKKFGGQVDALKDDLLRESRMVQQTQEFKDSVANIKSPTDRELINDFMQQSAQDLKKLSPEMLSDLPDILQNIADGYIDHYRLGEIITESRGYKRGEPVKEQIEKSGVTIENVAEKVKELGLEQAPFREGELGLGKSKAGAVTKFIYNPLMSAIEKANHQTQQGVVELKKIFGNANKQSRIRMNIVANMLQEYMAQFDPQNANVKDIGKRDWVKQVFDEGGQINFKDIAEANEVAKAWASLSGGKTKGGRPILDRGKTMKIEGNALDPEDIYRSFLANDGKYLTKQEGEMLAKWFKYAEEHNAEYQKAANEMRGKPFSALEFYAPRVSREGAGLPKEEVMDATVDAKSNRIPIASIFGHSRTSQEVRALRYDIVENAERAIANSAKDYHLTKALKEINATVGAATNKQTKPVLQVVMNDVAQSLIKQYGKQRQRDFLDKAASIRSTVVQLNPLKTVKEFTATASSMPTRGGKPIKGYAELFRKDGMKDILEFTGSPLNERLNVNQQFQLTEGEIQNLKPIQKLGYYLGGSPEMIMMKSVYMPNFKAAFKEITGADWDYNKFKTDDAYKVKYGEAINEANAVATNEVQKIVGPGSQFGARREIKLPLSSVSTEKTTGRLISFMSEYPYRENKEFWNGFREVGERYKAGEGLGSLGSLRKPLAVTINMMVYAYMASLTKTFAGYLMGDKEKEKREKELKEKFTPDGLANTIVGQVANMASAKYSVAGSTIAKSALAFAAYNTKDKETKDRIKKIAKENFYGQIPNLDVIMGDNKYRAGEAIGQYFANLIPALGVVAESGYAAKEVGRNITDVTKDLYEGKKITDTEKKQWNLINTGLNALHLFLMTQGGGLPSYYDLQKMVEDKAGKSKSGSQRPERPQQSSRPERSGESNQFF